MSRQPDAPRHIVATTDDADTVLRRLIRAGWSTRAGFALSEAISALPEATGDAARLVLHGRITDPHDAHQAVRAAAHGAGIVAVVDPDTPLRQALYDDLARLGPVHYGPTSPPGRATTLAADQRALLDRLAAGDTIAAAAAAEFLSLRTANRRIAEARALFGVRTTREAVVAYLRQDRTD